jgi:hypothetical protein
MLRLCAGSHNAHQRPLSAQHRGGTHAQSGPLPGRQTNVSAVDKRFQPYVPNILKELREGRR